MGMKCHYEILEVPKDADDSAIKAAYRKLALKWHPDKNLDNADFAKEHFQLVQQAYEVLSDRQERAWYDNHREQILRGRNAEFQDNSLDVFQYFTTTCFDGFNDEEKGFYTVYRKVFEEIMCEDMEYMEDKAEFFGVPNFGTSLSSYEEVVGPFYAYWTSYCTKKSYVWLDPHNINETRDRKIYKLMEKENKKIRLKAKKERNEEVRALVAFVRKRDKRVQEHSKKLEAKIFENRQKQEQLSKQKRLERKKQLNESKSQAEWTKFDNVKTELEQIEKSLAEEFGEHISDSEKEYCDSEPELDNLYCVACNKVFKTPKAFQNHELSKKHKENVEKLKDSVLCNAYETENESDSSSANDVKISSNINCSFSDQELTDIEVVNEGMSMKPKKKQRKSKNVIQVNLSDGEDFLQLDKQGGNDRNINTDDSDNHFNLNSSKKQRRKNKKSGTKTDKPVDKNINNAYTEKNENSVENAEETIGNDEQKVEKTKKSNKKSKDKKKEMETQHVVINTSHCCVTCKTDFPSKNKLFDHLKKTGHSVYLPHMKILKNKSVKEK